MKGLARAKQRNDAQAADRIFEALVAQGSHMIDRNDWNQMLHFHASKRRTTALAQRYFDLMRQNGMADVNSYNIFMGFLGRLRQFDEMEAVFRELTASPTLQPSPSSYNVAPPAAFAPSTPSPPRSA
jgi:pentatricopeptide repeat protein